MSKENENMNRKDLIEKIMKVAEHYKNGDLYANGAMTDIGILIDDYTETVIKNCSIPTVVGRREQLVCHRCNENEKQEVNDPCCIECKIEIEGQAN